jgi:chorismate mutase
MTTIRGATKIKSNTKKEIEKRVIELIDEILNENKITKIEAIIFSVTPDITVINPSTITRTHYKWETVSFMTFQEAIFENSEKSIIRVLVFCESTTKNFVYLNGTDALRK